MPTGLVTVKAGTRGVDFSFAKPPAARLVELGYEYVVGYISIPPASAGKNLSKAQCEEYLAAGLKVLLVWEMSATRPNLGAAVGATDGRNAQQLATARGYPTDVPILTAVDTNTVAVATKTVPANIDAHEAYVRAFADNCGPYPIGIYGDTDILTRCDGLWQIGWVPNAWSWSGTSRANAEAKARAVGAHVLQRTGFHIDNLWAVDPNDTIADFPAWETVTVPEQPDVVDPPIIVTPPSTDEEIDNMRIKVQPEDVWFEKVGLDVRPVGSGDEYAALGGNEVVLDKIEMAALINTTRYTEGHLRTDAANNQAAKMGPEFVALWEANQRPAAGGGGEQTVLVKVDVTGPA